MIDRAALYKVYKKEQTYQKTADHFGVSRQRIEMLLRNCPDPAVVSIQKSKRQVVVRSCAVCQRTYKRIMHKDNGNCFTCNTYAKLHPTGSGKAIRTLLYPKQCSKCQAAIGVHNRVNGKCNKCYNYDLARSPKRRAKMRLYVATHRARVNEASRRRYQKKKLARQFSHL